MPGIEVAVAGFRAHAEVIAGTLRNIRDCTASRVATEQCALRAAQDLDTLDLGDIQAGCAIACDVNAVEVNGVRSIEAEVGAAARGQSADRDDGSAVARGALDSSDVRREAADVESVCDLQLLKLLRTDSRNRNRHFLQVLLTLLRGHDNDIAWRVVTRFGHLIKAFRTGLRERRSGRHCQQAGTEEKARGAAAYGHLILPKRNCYLRFSRNRRNRRKCQSKLRNLLSQNYNVIALRKFRPSAY